MIRWLRANAAKYHLDPDHLGVWGSSAGDHLVAMLGATGNVKELDGKGGNLDQPSRVQCVIDWFGPSDLTRISGQARRSGGLPHRRHRPRKPRQGSQGQSAELHLQGRGPFLIMHGDQDNLVPLGPE